MKKQRFVGVRCTTLHCLFFRQSKLNGLFTGMSGTMFSETIRTSENMDYMIFPRLLALAERAWHTAEFENGPGNEEAFDKDWSAFAKAVGLREFERLDNLNIAFRIPPPGATYVLKSKTFFYFLLSIRCIVLCIVLCVSFL